jgi:hypothetical protein
VSKVEFGRQRGISYQKLSMIISVVLLLHTLALLPFFVFNPFAAGVDAVAVLQFASQVGWIFLVVIPPVALWGMRRHYRLSRSLLLFSALLWPVSLLLVRVVFAVTQQPVSFSYLYEFPMFVFSDVITPVIYVLVWRALSRKNAVPIEQATQLAPEIAENGPPLESSQVATRRSLSRGSQSVDPAR